MKSPFDSLICFAEFHFCEWQTYSWRCISLLDLKSVGKTSIIIFKKFLVFQHLSSIRLALAIHSVVESQCGWGSLFWKILLWPGGNINLHFELLINCTNFLGDEKNYNGKSFRLISWTVYILSFPTRNSIRSRHQGMR